MAEGKQFTSGAPKAIKPGAKTPKPKKQSYAVARKGIIARSKAKYGHAPTEEAVKATYKRHRYPVPGPKPRAQGEIPIGRKPAPISTPGQDVTGAVIAPVTPPKPPASPSGGYGTISAPPTPTKKGPGPSARALVRANPNASFKRAGLPKAPGSPAVRATGTKASKIKKF